MTTTNNYTSFENETWTYFPNLCEYSFYAPAPPTPEKTHSLSLQFSPPHRPFCCSLCIRSLYGRVLFLFLYFSFLDWFGFLATSFGQGSNHLEVFFSVLVKELFAVQRQQCCHEGLLVDAITIFQSRVKPRIELVVFLPDPWFIWFYCCQQVLAAPSRAVKFGFEFQQVFGHSFFQVVSCSRLFFGWRVYIHCASR